MNGQANPCFTFINQEASEFQHILQAGYSRLRHVCFFFPDKGRSWKLKLRNETPAEITDGIYKDPEGKLILRKSVSEVPERIFNLLANTKISFQFEKRESRSIFSD